MVRLFFLSFVLLNSNISFAQDWWGFCIIEVDDLRICNEPSERDDDFRLKCRRFAEDHGGYAWKARFSTDLEYLKSQMGDYCDEIKSREPGAMYSCEMETLCLLETNPITISLASRVYATDQQDAISRCAQKEKGRVMKEVKKQSQRDCYVKVNASLFEF